MEMTVDNVIEVVDSDSEEEVVEKLILEVEQGRNLDENEEFKEFDELSYDFKLERLQNLVKQSQVFSGIISDTLLQSSLSKKKETPQSQQVQIPAKKKSKRSNKSQQSILNFYNSTKGELNEETKKAKEELEQSTTNSTLKQPSSITGTTMRDYQLEGTEWLVTLYENGLNGILADEMGLGKTIQSIAMLAFLYEQGIKGPFLITAPLSTVGNWINEFKRFAPSIPVLGYIGSKDERKVLRTRYLSSSKIVVVVTSYETVLRDFEYLNKIQWNFLIVDEGHRLKNINCKLIKELKKLQTSNRLLITGTPLQNNLNELWSLLNFILPDIFHDLELFQKWFDFSSLTSLSNSIKDDKTKQLIDSKIQETLVENLHTILKPFLLRRLKKTVIKNLPPKREFIVYGGLTQTQSELYKNALYKSLKKSVLKFAFLEALDIHHHNKYSNDDIDSFLYKKLDSEYINAQDNENPTTYLRSDQITPVKKSRKSSTETKLEKIWDELTKSVETKSMQNLMMQLRLIVNSPYLFYFPWENTSSKEIDLNRLLQNSGKLQLLDQLVPKLISQGHKVLIFSQFVKMLDLIEDWCELNNLTSSRIDGSTKQFEREEEIHNFNNDNNVKVFLLSTRAGGLGLNLTKADSVIIFDSDWNPQVDLQAMDRVHRIGQEKPVVVYRFIIANTIEQVILAKADSKRKLEKLVIQMGKFESLKRLIKKDNGFGNIGGNSKDENQLAKELASLYEDDRFTKGNGDGLIQDSKLSDEELDELLNRNPESYERDLEYYDKFKHIQIFETTTSLN